MLRISGKRTLATVLLTKEVALAERVTALARSEPRLLLYRGKFLTEEMQAKRVTQSEILQAVRSQGILAIDEVEGVVLETDGTFSVIPGGKQSGRSSLVEVRPVHLHSENRS
ncbi:YetF domain-containing protein [Nitrosomonas sp. ANs5]|uniref:YetF domain-containing protein n=1 Tax=Nitrosomonas sp. ANs5 TaxID=3423941 RepID=UPI003D32A936